jgi:imidazolonepropionase-like amidohydrolase
MPLAHHFSFSKGSSNNPYPSAHIGAVALIRQTLYDAQWYEAGGFKLEFNPSLEALQNLGESLLFFELNNPLALRNVNAIENEFNLTFIKKTTGREYLLSDNECNKSKLLVPISFPDAFDVQDPLTSRGLSLGQLKHWEAAPFNIRYLLNKGAQVAITRDTTSSAKAFLKNLHLLHQTGLHHDSILAMLTTVPAKWIKKSNSLGALNPGYLANFFISNKPFTDLDFQLLEHWNKGELVYEQSHVPSTLIGQFSLVIDSVDYILNIKSIEKGKINAAATRKNDDVKLKASINIERSLVNISLKNDSLNLLYRLTGKQSFGGTVWDGKGQAADGSWVSWAAIKDRKSATTAEMSKTKTGETTKSLPALWSPNTGFGSVTARTQENFVITNAIVWTSADAGKLESADIWVEGGKIKAVGKGMMFPSDLKQIDAKGKHVTPGIIDEHSHIGIWGGVNEWARSSSAEVRIADAVDPWNIHIYRHLAGGVTAAQLLHGSANPIGGQSALIKMKWGASAEEMLIDDAPGFIKFALGENVKRSNSRDDGGRFPVTRMGVEQSFIDAFTNAKAYEVKTQTPSNNASKKTNISPTNTLVRKDLQLDAMVEILNSERYISCHSYVQSEILMLMRVAEQFGFRVNTFTHILEGYKVAQEMSEHGVSGSTFSDWWAYKFEVNDAIPYNAALMHRAGVNTLINSDDAEMGRRLNQEAAKTIKYGGVSEEDAFKMITINAAKALHLDHRTGSIEEGKDADLVIWNGHPLSIYSNPEQTFIEGIKYYDAAQQATLTKQNEAERARIISEMLKDKGTKKKAPVPAHVDEYHCDTILETY